MKFRSLLLVSQLMATAIPAFSFLTLPTLASYSESSMRLAAYSQKKDEGTMNYIENVVEFCQSMGYTMDEYDEMVGQLQDQQELLRRRAKTIDRLLNMLEQHESYPVARHNRDAVAKLNAALDLVLKVEGLQEFAPTQDEARIGFSDFISHAHLDYQVHRAGSYNFIEQSGPKPHPPISPPPKDLVQYSQGSNQYAKRRRHYSKVKIATPSDYTKEIKDYLKAVTANKIAALNNEYGYS